PPGERQRRRRRSESERAADSLRRRAGFFRQWERHGVGARSVSLPAGRGRGLGEPGSPPAPQEQTPALLPESEEVGRRRVRAPVASGTLRGCLRRGRSEAKSSFQRDP
ncbi:hypothetical protein JRQ81_001807, partial [Phrynocephalus forsythii]